MLTTGASASSNDCRVGSSHANAVGYITIDAIHNSDLPVIKAMATLTSLLYIFGNIMTDVIYTLVDPRVSLK